MAAKPPFREVTELRMPPKRRKYHPRRQKNTTLPHLGQHEKQVLQPHKKQLQRLWRQGDHRMPRMAFRFGAFQRWAMAHGYRDDLTIDRIDNDKGYSPDNCHWVTVAEQSRNKRSNHKITYKAETKTVDEWAAIFGLAPGTLYSRISRGWDIERALTSPAS